MYPVYKGIPRQYGRGLGSMFKSMTKSIIPWVKPHVQSAFKVLKNEGLKQGLGALQDVVLKRKSPRKVLKERAKTLGKALWQDIKGSSNTKPRQSKPRRSTRRSASHRPALRPRPRKQIGKGYKRSRRSLRKHRQRITARPLDIFD